MNNPYFLRTVFLHVFDQQTTVTLFWSLFRAEETSPIELFDAALAKDVTLL